MPTSGTYSFTVTRDDVIQSAFRLLGVYGTGETPSTADYTNATQALNILIKSWMKKNIELWTVQDISFATVQGTTSYLLGTGGTFTTYRPLRIIEAYLRDSNNNDVPLTAISRQEYLQFGMKSTQGVPNSFYYDKQLSAGVLYLYNTPADATHTLHLVVQRPIQDITASSDNFDFPQEWFQAIKWGLAEELAPEYGYNLNSMQMITMKAEKYLEDNISWDQEDAPTFFTPDARMR
jgi:hypothetical protein